MLVKVLPPGDGGRKADAVEEIRLLAQAAGVEVCGYICQKRYRVNPAMYIGKGKAEEIADIINNKHDVDVVIFDNDLTPAQIRELEKVIGRRVIDRSELILDIFATRARSAEARLQVELAQLQYTYPRLVRMWSHLDTVTAGAAVGGVGTRGPGESQLEIDRRLVNKRIASLKKQIGQITKRRQREVASRSDNFTVSLIGYTNAGKSTLMNTLTGNEVYAADKLFATLDTKTVRWKLGGNHHVLLSDTVGFIRNLPHHLVASFRATLEQTIHADLLLHVVDVSHRQAEEQIEAANKVLQGLGCEDKDVIIVLNKTDKPEGRLRSEVFSTLYPGAIAVSAHTGVGIDKLVEAVTERLTGQKVRLRLGCSVSDDKVLNFIKANGTITRQECNDSMLRLEAWLGRKQVDALKRLNPYYCHVVTTTNQQ